MKRFVEVSDYTPQETEEGLCSARHYKPKKGLAMPLSKKSASCRCMATNLPHLCFYNLLAEVLLPMVMLITSNLGQFFQCLWLKNLVMPKRKKKRGYAPLHANNHAKKPQKCDPTATSDEEHEMDKSTISLRRVS